MTRRWRVSALLLGLSLGLSRSGVAQDSVCTYDACALRLQHRTSGLRVVAGGDARLVAKLGLFFTRIPVLEQSRDSAVRTLYTDYRSHQGKATALAIIGTAVHVAGVLIYYADRYDRTNQLVSIGLVGAGLGFVLGAGHHGAAGMDALSQSIWQYNRGLTR